MDDDHQVDPSVHQLRTLLLHSSKLNTANATKRHLRGHLFITFITLYLQMGYRAPSNVLLGSYIDTIIAQNRLLCLSLDVIAPT
ncbi:hypothetical protein O181_026810 [Austropuccinia psidii MF-1]|uniref:Uncharacterized protein n=1 Tax=Austropuccinia psidii MF-1 TaxID=1389203 RepID=A0A9Q3CPY7_9BASI|nr:hypothetical protein [Austropuccinia psidii MF-1]